MQLLKLDSSFLEYLANAGLAVGERLPTLESISRSLGISIGKLREQLEVARHLGLVSVRPKVGTVRESFDFGRTILPSVLFSLASGEATFAQFSQLRRAIETNMWLDAAVLLTTEDKQKLRQVMADAWSKLRGEPVHVPNGEHRQLHLTIFKRLQNPFVLGVLEAYWDAYEASELTRYASYQYWLRVWNYHERIVDALCEDRHEMARALLVEHFDLLPSVMPAAEQEAVFSLSE